ncbi:putative acetyltransferase [Roseovarius sp. A-2]|uniref:GNAT family N-acetyltransferase n=1 Tax=Roseovarius sp. A-2 TaxID=1570360 RepID=UPI0009B53D30|nr:GNAT family N-acetyltransferase [Roseovarius sp. A-2]GAW34572.1 putative acetyltransferase [Roseovarius sp. A-2]
MTPLIRTATASDAAGAICTLHRSITELCVADHENDAEKIEAWLGNKTVGAWERWVARDDAVLLVALREKTVVGIGMAALRGEILLNYVHPDARFSGVSKAVLAAMERDLRSCKVPRCELESTMTARCFYESCGYTQGKDNAAILSKSL